MAVERIADRANGARLAEPPPRVMLLTSDLGAGHTRASSAIETALRGGADRAVTQSFDVWSLLNPQVAAAVHQAYLCLATRHADVYHALYGMDYRSWHDFLRAGQPPSDALRAAVEIVKQTIAGLDPDTQPGRRFPSDRWLLALLCSMLPTADERSSTTHARSALISWTWSSLARRFEQRLRAFQPDVVVATQLIPAALYASLRRRGRYHAPSVGVITDYGVHAFWSNASIDHFCLPHPSVVGALENRVSPQRLSVTGIPLMPEFAHPPTQQQARSELGLEQHVPIVLVAGGGLGLNVQQLVDALEPCREDVCVVAMTGRNGTAARELEGRSPHRHLIVRGWTDQMAIYVAAADLVVGKAGGVTVAEALACGRPLLATGSLQGQERFNVDFLERHQAGRRVPLDALAREVRALALAPGRLRHAQQQARQLGRGDAAAHIVDIALAAARPAHRPVEALA